MKTAKPGKCCRRTIVVFKTNKLRVTSEDFYASIDEVPGVMELARQGFHDALAMIKQNLDKPSLCLQIVATRQASKVAHSEQGDMIAAYGWKVCEILGQGKDGITFWGYRYDDDSEEMNIVKILTQYAKLYNNHTEIFNAILRKCQERKAAPHTALLDHVVKNDYTNYKCDQVYKHIKQDRKQIHKALSNICKMNAWCIANTGFVFWDLGYSNGRNFMIDRKGTIKWVDYGGAGMLQCKNFKEIYDSYKGLPVLTQQAYPGKLSLVAGRSDFVFCQFLFNYEFWSQPNTTADLYSSMLQVKSEVIPEITKWVLPNVLSTKISRQLYEKYKGWDWLDDRTWKSVGKFFDANT